MVTTSERVRMDLSHAGVARVVLNRPDKRNAFDAAMIADLLAVFERLADDASVRVVILSGEGKTFCAGADAAWMASAAEQSEEENRADARVLAAMLRTLYELPQLTLALVHGAAMGGGAGLVAACDVAIAVAGAKFRFTEVRLGLTPATISPFVIEAVGPRWARALFATAEGFDAAYAEKLGLIHFVVEDDAALRAEAERHIAQALDNAPGAVADAKRLVRDLSGRPINADIDADTANRIAARRASREGREGLAAFLDKRQPNWTNPA